MTNKESVRASFPTAVCKRQPKERYQKFTTYIVFVDDDPEFELGRGLSAHQAWKDSFEMIQYIMLRELEK